MDEYLQCLYNCVIEHISAAKHPNTEEYHRCMAVQDKTWSALKDALSPAQLGLVEDYRSAWSGISGLEDELLFQTAVSLGKWMAQH